MKYIYRKFTILLLITVALFQDAKADGLIGGQITYRLIDTSAGRYRFTLELYRDCATILLGTEQLEIITPTFSTTVSLNLKSLEEITPVASPPDVSAAITTNCPSGAPLASGLMGIQKATFEVDYTIGRNVGWAFVGWNSCCRNFVSNIHYNSSSSLWIQAAFNTNYVNSSPVMQTPRFTRFAANVDNDYSLLASEMYDDKYIKINGNLVLRDSFAYEMIIPFVSRSNNQNLIINLQNPQIQFLTGLTAQNYLNVNYPSSLNQKTGLLTVNPLANQTACFAYAVKEYRAIPNANNTSYSRVYIGHTMREALQFVDNGGSSFIVDGIIKSMSDIDTLIDKHTAGTCNFQNKIVFQVKGAPYQNLKIRDLSVINPKDLKNYKMKFQKLVSNNVETMTVTLTYDKLKNVPELNFQYYVFSVNSQGYMYGRIIPIKMVLGKGKLSLSQDTAYLCTLESSVRLDASIGGTLRWSPKTNIVGAESLDSGWIEVNPTSNKWYYFNNIASNPACVINDSIYVKLITCDTVYGYMYTDGNKSCSFDLWELPIRKDSFIVRGVSNSFFKTVVVDTYGFYKFVPPSNNTYTIESDGKYFNCAVNPLKQQFFLFYGNKKVDIHVRDSAVIDDIVQTYIDTNNCFRDSVFFGYTFHKSYGSLRAFLYYGNGDSTIFNYKIDEGYVVLNKKYLYKTPGSYKPRIVFFNKQNLPFDTIEMSGIFVSSCIYGKIYVDNNSNCLYSSSDSTIPYHKLVLKNNSTQAVQPYFTDSKGNYKIVINKSTSYELSNEYTMSCYANSNKIDIPSYPSDTNLQKDFPISLNNPVNYKLLVIPSGAISNTDKLRLRLTYRGFQIKHTNKKVYEVTLPVKASFDSISAYATYSNSGKKYVITQDSGYQYVDFYIRFDSLNANDDLCFQVVLRKVMPETDTSDNGSQLCLQTGFSYQNNVKSSAIKSLVNHQDFTNKNDDIFYQINFQNRTSSYVQNMKIEDVLDSKLDISTVEMVASSHPVQLYIYTNTRKLEFQLNQINLPDSLSNPKESVGYVIFKVKAMPSIALNDMIQNSASIYMNSTNAIPTGVVKNKYTDAPVISILPYNREEWSVFPNPVRDILQIRVPEGAKNWTIHMYSMDGKEISQYQNKSQINLESYQKGIYLIKIETKGMVYRNTIIKSE